MPIYIVAIAWFFAIVIIILAMNGWLINFFYAACMIIGALVDVACQAWLDIRKLWGKRVTLDEHEQHLS